MRRLLSVFLAIACCAANAAAAGKPNVVFLLADDMRADSIAALGNPLAKTPNLDTLVQQGFVFRNAYCLGGNSGAVCTPSRNMLLSGNGYFRWKDFTPPGGRKGMLAPGDGPNFPLSLRDAGYTTYHYGKRGNTAPLIQARFDVEKYLSSDQGDRANGEPGREIMDGAIEFVKQRKDAKPFFLYLAVANPHDPRVAAKKYMDQYAPAKIPLPKNWLPVHPFDNGEMTIRDEKLLPWPRTETDLRRTHHEYYATITGLDFHFGRFLQTLKDLRLYENTVFVFSADQGIAIGSHGLLGKQSLYDAAMKVPLIFAGPGVPKGGSDALMYLLDIYPTVCDLVGAPVPAKIDGRSFKPVIQGRVKSVRDELLLSYLGVQKAVRDLRWKLIRYPQVNVTQLFDLQSDPHEMHNLEGDPAQRERVAAMLARLKDLQRQWGDDQPLEVADPKPSAWTPPPAGQLKKAASPRKGKKK